MSDIFETLHQGYGQFFSTQKILHEEKSELQHLLIFENDCFGRVLMLDGIVQTTEKDEFIYHEMLAHVPLFSHPNPQRVLIVGGGDGGILREVVRHPTVQCATLVEIDQLVVDLATTYFPFHADGAFDNPKTELIIADASQYVQQAQQQGQTFDVIISDSTDPIGPAEVLFASDFYQACAALLADDGIFVAQNGVYFLQRQEAKTSFTRLQPHFADAGFYHAAVPTYVGGSMLFAWGCHNAALRTTAVEQIVKRFTHAQIDTHYYTPSLHAASFALPRYIEQHLADDA